MKKNKFGTDVPAVTTFDCAEESSSSTGCDGNSSALAKRLRAKLHGHRHEGPPPEAPSPKIELPVSAEELIREICEEHTTLLQNDFSAAWWEMDKPANRLSFEARLSMVPKVQRDELLDLIAGAFADAAQDAFNRLEECLIDATGEVFAATEFSLDEQRDCMITKRETRSIETRYLPY